VAFVDHGPKQLVVTFDNLAELGNRTLMRSPWSYSFFEASGASVLGVMARKGIWYREEALIDFLQSLSEGGFFAQFERVLFTGNSMGGFGAMAFAPLAPGCDVLAFSPQTTLNKSIVPWEERFTKAWEADWTLPYSDAAQTLGTARRVDVIYDPHFEPDHEHIKRLSGPNLTVYKAWYASHKSPVFLRRIDALKPITEAAMAGNLTPALFYELYRERRNTPWYRNALRQHAKTRGHPELARKIDEIANSQNAKKHAELDDKWMKAGRALAAKHAKIVPAVNALKTKPSDVLLVATAEDLGPMTARWLVYHSRFFDIDNITILHGLGHHSTQSMQAETAQSETPPVLECNQLHVPRQAQRARLYALIQDALALGRPVMALTTDDYLAIDPEITADPLAYLLSEDGRAQIAPFAIKMVHHRLLNPNPIEDNAPVLAQRPVFELSSTATRPRFFTAAAPETLTPPVISSKLQIINTRLIDHDRACLTAARNQRAFGRNIPGSVAVSAQLDDISTLTPKLREPVGPRVVARLYGNWLHALENARDPKAVVPAPLVARQKIFNLPPRYHSLF